MGGGIDKTGIHQLIQGLHAIHVFQPGILIITRLEDDAVGKKRPFVKECRYFALTENSFGHTMIWEYSA